MSNEIVTTEYLFNENTGRIFDIDGIPYLAVTDLESAIGTKRGTISQIIKRHPERFEGRVLIDVSLTAIKNVSFSKKGRQSLTLIDEKGMYMVFDSISINQLSNPRAKDTILRFQKFVPELLQKWREGKLVQINGSDKPALRSLVGEIFRSNMLIATTMSETFGIDMGIAGAQAITNTESETGANLYTWKKMLPASLDSSISNLNAGEVGKILGYSAEDANIFLLDLGFQKRSGGDWVVTEDGMEYGAMFPYDRRGHSGYQVRWKEDKIIELATEYGFP